MTTEDFIGASDYQKHQYQKKNGTKMTERQFIIQQMGYSGSHVDRSRYFYHCIDEIQNLILCNIISVSCADQIGHKSAEMQKQIYTILMEARKEGFPLSRDRIVTPISSAVKENPYITWAEIKPSIKTLKRKPKKDKENRDSQEDIGKKFEEKIVDLISGSEFVFAMKNRKESHDFKEDIFAVDKNQNICSIQCKYHGTGESESDRAVKEAALGKLNYSRDYAIAVTNTSFSIKAKKCAKELNVCLWDGDYLRTHFGWNDEMLTT